MKIKLIILFIVLTSILIAQDDTITECNCNCIVLKDFKMKGRSKLQRIAPFNQIQKEVGAYINIDTNDYKNIYVIKHIYSSNHNISTIYEQLDLYSDNSISFKLPAYGSLKFTLNPCSIKDQICATPISISSFRPINSYVYGFDIEDFKYNSESIFYLLIEEIAPIEDEDLLYAVTEVVQKSYNMKSPQEALDSIFNFLNSENFTNIQNVSYSKIYQIEDKFYYDYDELLRLLFSSFFNHGDINPQLNYNNYLAFKKKIDIMYPNKKMMEFIDNSIKLNIDLSVSTDYIAIDFPASLLKQTSANNTNSGARLLIPTDEVAIYGNDRNPKFHINKKKNICFTKAQIGNTKCTIELDSISTIDMNIESDNIRYDSTLLGIFQNQKYKNQKYIFVSNATLKLPFGSKPNIIKCENIFVNGNNIIGKLVTVEEKPFKKKHYRFFNRKFDKIEVIGDTVIYFSFNIDN